MTSAGAPSAEDDAMPGAAPMDLEAEIAQLRRQARRQTSELAALLERLDELQEQISRHQQYLDRGRP